MNRRKSWRIIEYLILACFVLTLSSCSSKYSDTSDSDAFVKFVRSIIDKPNDYQSTILNSEFVDEDKNIRKYCIPEVMVNDLAYLKNNSYKIIDVVKAGSIRQNILYPTLIIKVRANDMCMEFSFIKINSWKLNRIEIPSLTDSE